MVVEPGKHPQPMGDAAMIQPTLRERAIKDLDPSLKLPEAALHIVANSAHDPDPPGLSQKEQGTLIPRTAVHNGFPGPAAIDPSQLFKEVLRGDQGAISAHPQVKDAAGLGVHSGPDPTEASPQLDPGLIDHDSVRQGAFPDRPLGGEGLNPIPYSHVGDADSPLGEEQGGPAQAQTLGVGSQPERDGPGGSPFSLNDSVLAEESAQLVEGYRHRYHLPSSLPNLALLNGAVSCI